MFPGNNPYDPMNGESMAGSNGPGGGNGMSASTPTFGPPPAGLQQAALARRRRYRAATALGSPGSPDDQMNDSTDDLSNAYGGYGSRLGGGFGG